MCLQFPHNRAIAFMLIGSKSNFDKKNTIKRIMGTEHDKVNGMLLTCKMRHMPVSYHKKSLSCDGFFNCFAFMFVDHRPSKNFRNKNRRTNRFVAKFSFFLPILFHPLSFLVKSAQRKKKHMLSKCKESFVQYYFMYTFFIFI